MTALETIATIRQAQDHGDGQVLTDEQRTVARAKVATDGVVESMSLVHSFSHLEECHIRPLREWGYQAAADVHAGDLSRAESQLIAQSLALNSIFGHYARKAAAATHIDAAERFLRMALKAQNQGRMTLETLAQVKNPLTGAYVRQANVAAGHQQVNNGADIAPTGEPEVGQTKQSRRRQRLDARTPERAERGHPSMEALGTLNRPAVPAGQAASKSKRLEGGHA